MEEKKQRKLGSPAGLAATVAIGFALYFLIPVISGSGSQWAYSSLIEGVTSNVGKQLLWFLMNFTEPNFFAGVFSGAMVILGGFVAWRLSMKNSRFKGFDICYGSSSLWPYVLASQLLSLAIAIFVCRYILWFDGEGVTWIPTFISVVGAPPSVVLLYGPSLSALFTSSILGGVLCAPTAYWLSNTLVPMLGVPGVVANVLAMAITGILICMTVKMLPFVHKVPVVPHTTAPAREEDVYSASWSVRRALADFTEPHFYGNEVASLFLLAGLLIDCILSGDMAAYGGGAQAVGAVLLSQFIGAGVGVFLYAYKFDHGGWYATYVPVVSVGPACVLMFGASVPVAVLAGVLGGILGGPVAEFFSAKLPEGVHGTNANVLSMTICTCIVAIVFQGLGF